MSTHFENMILMIQNMGLNNIGNQIQNMGIQMLNMGTQILNIPIIGYKNDNLNAIQQIQNIIMQLNNIGMRKNMENQMIDSQMLMNNMMPNNNINNNINNNFIERNTNNNNFNHNKPKKNFLFKNLKGEIKALYFDYGTTVSEMIRKYLEEIGKPYLFNNDEIRFLHSSFKLNFNDQTKIEEKFKGIEVVHIIVHDNKPLIGG